MEEGVFLNSVPSTLAFASNVAGTAAALQAEKGQIISSPTFHITADIKKGLKNLKKSTAGVVDAVHHQRRRWEVGGAGGHWGWRPTPASAALWRSPSRPARARLSPADGARGGPSLFCLGTLRNNQEVRGV